MFRGQNSILITIPAVGVIFMLMMYYSHSSIKFNPLTRDSINLKDVKVLHEEQLNKVKELKEMIEKNSYSLFNIAKSMNVSVSNRSNVITTMNDNNITTGVVKVTKGDASPPQQKPSKNNPSNIRLVNQDDVKPFDTQILFLVFSHIANVERRTTIRRTWGNLRNFPKQRAMFKNATFKVVFITGYLPGQIEKAKVESKTYGDILITNRTENYFDISRRTQFGIQWTVKNCKFDYFFKTDDDVFVSIPNTYKLFYQDSFAVEHKTTLYAGLMHLRGGPIRDKKSKWYINRQLWGQGMYAPFATGMAIILSRDVAASIEPYFEWKNVFPLEDVNIGFYVFIARVPNIGVRPSKGPEFVLDYSVQVCFHYRPVTITMHPVKNEQCMRRLMETSLRT